jgi:hypothetical protein
VTAAAAGRLAALLCLAAAAWPGARPAGAQEELFVPHAHQSQSGLRVFTAGGPPDAGPIRTISGALSGITFPGGVAVDPCADELVITNADTALGQVSLRVFPRSGQDPVSPLRVIQGQATLLGDPHGVAMAPDHDEIIVANLIGVKPITVYDRLGPAGQAPTRSVAGPATGISMPWGVAFDPVRDEIIVASSGNASIRAFDRTARDDAPPRWVIQGPGTGLGQVRGVAVDAAPGLIAVADLAGSVKLFAVPPAAADQPPLDTLPGLQQPVGVAFGPLSGDLFVTEADPGNRVKVFARGAGGSYALDRVIEGPAAGLAGPSLPAVAPAALQPTTLVAAVLPLSRSVRVGGPEATAFATIINSGAATACRVGIAPGLAVPAGFFFQRTDPATNQPVGPVNAPVSIAPGAAQTFVIGFSPTDAFGPVDMPFVFAGANTLPVPVLVGINTLLLSASLDPVPDVVALAVTPSNDGVVRIPGPAGTGVFAVATSNLGIGDTISVTADTGAAALPLTVLACRSDPATAQCADPPAPSLDVFIGAGETPTFSFFATAGGLIVLDPAANRIFVRFRASNGLVRGATGVAVTTE